MICYAIKNEEGKYLGIASNSFDHYWTTIEWAYYWRDVDGVLGKDNAENFRDREYSNCKVVKVEIKEVDDE